MNTGAIYAVTAFVCMLQILLIFNRSRATEYRETIDVPFCNMLCFFVVFCLLDSIWGMFAASLFGVAPTGFLIASYGYHIAAALSGNVGIGYGLSYVQVDPKEKKVLNVCRGALLALQFLVLGYNVFHHSAFWVDEQGHYYTGSLRFTLYALQLIYYVMLMIYTGYKWIFEKENKRLYRNAFLFAFIPWLFGMGQYLIYDVAMYSLGFTFAIFVLYTYKVMVQRENFMKEKMSSLDRMQSSIIHRLAGNFVSIYYVDLQTDEYEIYRNSRTGSGLVKEEGRHRNYFENASETAKQDILPEDLPIFQESFSRERIEKELEKKGMYQITIRMRVNGQEQYFQYRFVRPATEAEQEKLIVGIYNVDEEIRAEQERAEQIRQVAEREALLKEKVYMDAMTGLYNRMAYEEDLKTYAEKKIEQNLVYLSIDLNGLKTANDSLGHEAGDELLKGAAFCLNTCLGSYGKVYRTGGDEFVAMIFADRDKLYEILTDLDRTVAGWSGETVKELTISYGFVAREEKGEMDLLEIAKLADKRMYQDKEDFYANRGIDRRGQQEAYDAICNSYIRIFKINLTTQRFSVIRTDNREGMAKIQEARDDISAWLQDFSLLGQVHEDDREEYLRSTDIDFLRGFFRLGNRVLAIHYRRMIGEEYKRVMMEMIPAREYTDEEQIVFLYEKNISR